MMEEVLVPDRPYDLIFRVRNPDLSPENWKQQFGKEWVLNSQWLRSPRTDASPVLSISHPVLSPPDPSDPATRHLALVTLCDSIEIDPEIEFPESECPWLGPILGFAGVHFLTIEGDPIESEDLEQIAFSLAELSLGNFLLFPRNGSGAIDFESVEQRSFTLDLSRYSFDFGDELISRKLSPGGYLSQVIRSYESELAKLELELPIFFIEHASKCPIRYNFREGDYNIKYRGKAISPDDPEMPLAKINELLIQNSVVVWVKSDLESELFTISWMIEGYKYAE